MKSKPNPRRAVSAAGVVVLLALALVGCAGSSASSSGPGATVSAGPTTSPLASPTVVPPSASAPVPTASAAPGATPAASAFEAVRARSPWFDGVKAKDPNLIGQAAWWTATPSADGGWAVTVTIGWGDCPSGCIDKHVWQWQVARDGSVSFVSQSGSALPADQRAALAGAATSSGIGGEVTAGPTCPVERPGDASCAERPVGAALLIIEDGSGKEVARFTTDGSGLFRIPLPAGTYTVTPRPVSGFIGGAPPQQATVADGKLTVLTVSYDTGIR